MIHSADACLSYGVCRLHARVQLKTLSSPRLRSQATFKAPTKRLQHANATYRNIVGRNMLRAFGHPVATCCDVLGVVGSNLAIFKLEPTTPNTSQQGGQTHATCRAHTMLRYVALACCDRLVGALKSQQGGKTNAMLQSFGRGKLWFKRARWD